MRSNLDIAILMTRPTILWLRQDLRLSDHAALAAAVAEGPVVPVYILDDAAPGRDAMGGAQRWWLHHSLHALAASLDGKGASLVLRKGDSLVQLRQLMKQTGAQQIHATRQYEPWWQHLDTELGDILKLHDGNQLAPPSTIRTGSGGRYKIFTPYWRALLDRMPPSRPLPVPEHIESIAVDSDDLNDWRLIPTHPNWAGGFDVWTPGEQGAKAAFRSFLDRVGDYDRARNMPSENGTSRLSPHLHFGEISPATIWHHVAKKVGSQIGRAHV